MKTIATFTKTADADNFRAFLEGSGISAFVRDEITGASYSNAIGGIRVDVREIDFERAQGLYASAANNSGIISTVEATQSLNTVQESLPYWPGLSDQKSLISN
jgi:hypothetical protein